MSDFYWNNPVHLLFDEEVLLFIICAGLSSFTTTSGWPTWEQTGKRWRRRPWWRHSRRSADTLFPWTSTRWVTCSTHWEETNSHHQVCSLLLFALVSLWTCCRRSRGRTLSACRTPQPQRWCTLTGRSGWSRRCCSPGLAKVQTHLIYSLVLDTLILDIYTGSIFIG